jgi:secondary thiamine-phosphate synthase enzyme
MAVFIATWLRRFSDRDAGNDAARVASAAVAEDGHELGKGEPSALVFRLNKSVAGIKDPSVKSWSSALEVKPTGRAAERCRPTAVRTPHHHVGECRACTSPRPRLSIATAPREIKEITAEVARWTERQRISIGLLTLYIPHTSASLLIQENASPDVRRGLDAFLLRIVPENIALYCHNDEGPDDMPAHIKSALTQTQLSIPVTDGQ